MMRKAVALTTLAALGLGAGSALAQTAPDPSVYAEDVTAEVQGELQLWIHDPVIIYAILESNDLNAGLSDADIKRLDAIWIAEKGEGPMIFDLLDRQASILMRDRRELSKGVITEIILMDNRGINVGISDPASDFFQGDEAKYKQTFLKGPDAVFVDKLEYDESTKLVQTQVSMSVTDPETGRVIGAVTFGINLAVLHKLRGN
jgi:hypothetical protein